MNKSWYPPPSRPRPVEGGLKARSARGAIAQTWWSQRFIAVLEDIGLGNRLQRGRTYARKGQVISLEVDPGSVSAEVQGSRARPYRIRIGIPAFGKSDWAQVERSLAENAWYTAKLLSGEMPDDIEDVLAEAKLSLLPHAYGELRASCDCPDEANPCKHTAAVYYVLAERFDTDPFALFTLRGRTREELLGALRARRARATGKSALRSAVPVSEREAGGGDGARPLPDLVDRFWRAGPELAELHVSPLAGESPDALVRRLGPLGPGAGGDEVAEVLAAAYRRLAAAAERRALTG